jgi:hypothetical protein
VVEAVGLTLCDPEAWTVPIPSIVTSVALVVCQLSVVDCPCSIVAGFAVIEAVGAGGGGGGGGGGGATFFLHALKVSIAANATTSAIHFIFLLVT